MIKYLVTSKISTVVCLSSFLLLGCVSSSSTDEIKVKERCYDGVVYIKEKTGQSNLTVKFNSDGTVATKLISGISCIKQ